MYPIERFSINPFLRTSDIFIGNYTSYDWVRTYYEEYHGRFDLYPSSTIPAGGHTYFRVTNKGVKMTSGPEGALTYTTNVNGQPVRLTFTWSNPVGFGPNLYMMTTSPVDHFFNYTLQPVAPSGHEQDIAFRVYDKEGS